MQQTGRHRDRAMRAAAGGLAFATVAGFLGGLAWWLDLFSHFRVHYLMAAAILAVAALGRRRRWTAAVGVALVAANAAAVVPALPGIAAVAADAGGGTIKVVAFNLNYGNRDYARVADFLRREDADIVFLTEASPGWRALVRDLAGLYPHQLIGTSAGGSKFGRDGIAVLSKRPWLAAEFRRNPLRGWPTFVGRFDGGTGTFRLIATHLMYPYTPRGHRTQEREVDFLVEAVNERPDPVLLVGDLNMTPWSNHWRRLVGTTGLRGASGLVPTWPSPLAAIGIPIDHALGKGGVRVVKAWTGPALGSDHRPLIAEVRLPRRP